MMLRRLKHEALRLIVVLTVLYVGILVYVVVTEDAQVFPAAYRARPDRVPDLPQRTKPIKLTTADGESLNGYEMAPPTNAPEKWCIFFTGQWGRARWDLPKIALMRDLGFSVLTFDYRGYFGSTGKPSEAGFYRDADAAYDHLTKALHVPPSRIVLWAHSLGTGVAVDLASRSAVGGLIVDGAYDSIPACAAARYPWLPVRQLARNQFASIEKVARISVPKLFLHGEFDESIPIHHGRTLFEAATDPKTFIALEGRHEDFQWSDEARFRSAVTSFIQQPSLQ